MKYLIIGKSATGKDTVLRLVIERTKLERIVQYTTRPIKDGEINGREYYFIDDKEKDRIIAKGRCLEFRTYLPANAQNANVSNENDKIKWTYLTTYEKVDALDDCILIGTLPVLEDLRKRYGAESVRAIYIYTDDAVRLQRAIDREKKLSRPNYNEVCRRFLADADDFSQDKLDSANIDFFVENKELEDTVNEIVKYIKRNEVTNEK